MAIFGGFFFACIAGAINMVVLLSTAHAAVSHLTGTISLLARAAITGDESGATLRLAVVLSGFLIGAILAGVVVGDGRLSFRRRYGVLSVIEGLLLLAAFYLFQTQRAVPAEGICALVCGLQNGMVTTVSGAIVRTTHLTGIITDIGTHIGRILRGERLDRVRMILHLSILGGFVSGAIGTVVAFPLAGYRILIAVSCALVLFGVTYFCVRQWVYAHLPSNDAD